MNKKINRTVPFVQKSMKKFSKFLAHPLSFIIHNSYFILFFFLTASLLTPCLYAAETYVFDTKWGSYGSGDGQFYYPNSVAVDASGNVYVADRDNYRIQKFTSTGTFLTKWGSYGSGDGQFYSPYGIAVDASGNVFVADRDNHRIQKFTSTGTFITKWGSYGTGDGQLYYPRGVAMDSTGNVYVVDAYNHRIQKFTSTGTFITKWGSYGSGDGQFYYPNSVVVDASSNVYVADTENNRIQKFTSAGTFLTKWGSYGSGDGQFYNPYGIAVDASSNVYVADASNNRIQKFTSAGTFLTKWGSYGSGDGQFYYPNSVAVDASGNVYVADTSNYRIQRFKSSPAGSVSNLEDFETGDFSKFNWQRSGNAPWSITSTQKYSGNYSARAGTITHSQSTTLQVTLTVTLAGNITFYKKVSSEGGYDYLRFYIDGIQQDSWSGEVAWSASTYTVTTGTHTFKWTYSKDGSASVGSDTAWIDEIRFPPLGDMGRVAGRVTKSDGLTALSGATVEVLRPGTTTQVVATANTGSDGRYLIGVATGTYDVQATASGYVVNRTSGVVVITGSTATVNFALSELVGYISGKVTKDDGITAIRGAVLEAMQDNVIISSVTSNATGDYSLTLTSGTYDLRASSSGYLSQIQTNISVYLFQTSTVNFSLAASVYIPQIHKFVAKWGSYGSGNGQFYNPWGIAVDGSGNVYAADYDNHRIQKFSSDGTFLTKWGSQGSGDGQFSYPSGVSVDSLGNVYVADYNNSRIQKFTSDGAFIMKWGGTTSGSSDGQFYFPYGVAVDAGGNVYVADTYNHRIQKFTSTGTFITKWGSYGSGDGYFSYPYAIAVDNFGNVYVDDSSNYRIQKFTSNGTFLTKWGSYGSGNGQFNYPYGVTTDNSGNLYVADYNNHRIQKFDSDGTFLTKWGSYGSGEGQFSYPRGIAIDTSGNLYVGDSSNYRIQKFRSYPAGWISGKVSKSADGTVISGALVEALQLKENIWQVTASSITPTGGTYSLFVPTGTYKVRASASGFSIDEKTNISVLAGQSITINLSLIPGFSVKGLISANTTWTKTNSPYLVKSNVLVDTGVTLTIEPGVVVKFTTGTYLRIDGALKAQGTSGSHIIFTSDKVPPASGDWQYIKFMNTSDDANCVIDYAEIGYAQYGIYCDNASPTRISNTTISNNSYYGIYASYTSSATLISNNTITANGGYGIYVANGGSRIENNTITSNKNYGIYLSYSAPRIEGNVISGHTDYGIYVSGSLSGYGSLKVTGNTIDSNRIGFYDGWSNKLELLSNTISNNSEMGIYIATEALIGRNQIINNGSSGSTNSYAGIRCSGSSINISSNTISGNSHGITINSYSPTITKNNVYSNTNYNTYNNTANTIQAPNNWWGTTNTTQINEKIFDFYDDFNLGKVVYTPIATQKFANAPPSKTTNLSASTGTAGGYVNLSWTAPGGDGTDGSASYYSIRYTTDSIFVWDSATVWKDNRAVSGAYGTSETEIVTGLIEGATYSFAIKTVNSESLWSELSNIASVVVPAIAPSAVVDLIANPGAVAWSVDLSWTAPGDDGTSGQITKGKFQVRCTSYPAQEFSKAAYEVTWTTTVSPGTQQFARIGNLASRTTYYFWLRTADESLIWSDLSNKVTSWAQPDLTRPTGSPSRPTDEGVYTLRSSITFTWTAGTCSDPESGLAGYYLEVKDNYTTVFSSDVGNVTYYGIIGCLHGRTYYAQVKARNGEDMWSDWSDWSDGITVDTTPPIGSPATPTDRGDWGTVNLTFSWSTGTVSDSESGIAGYWLAVSTAPGGEEKFSAYVGNVSSYTVSGCENGKVYYAKVRARNGAGLYGSWSGNSDGITVDAIPPIPPQNFKIELPSEETQIKQGEGIQASGKTEVGATVYEVKIKDQNGNILTLGIDTSGLTVDAQGNISGSISLGDLTKNYPLTTGITMEIIVADRAGNPSTAAAASLVVYYRAVVNKLTLYNNLFDPTKGEQAMVRYELTSGQEVSIKIYDFRGNLVRDLFNGYRSSGIYTQAWNGKNDEGVIVASGIYLIQIKAGSFKETKKVAVVE